MMLKMEKIQINPVLQEFVDVVLHAEIFVNELLKVYKFFNKIIVKFNVLFFN